MWKRILRVAAAASLAIALVLTLAGSALAWSDLGPDDWGRYGLTEEQIKVISDGYPDGTWKPYDEVSRSQSAKMAVVAFEIPLVDPDAPTYTDVPKDDPYYRYIETAAAAGVTRGIGGGLFAPSEPVTREQAVAMIARWVALRDGYDISSMYTKPDVDAVLARFSDGDLVSPNLQSELAFAVEFGIVMGNRGALLPKDHVTRIQYAAELVRSEGQTADDRSYYLGNFAGVIGTEAEFAMNEAKDLSLSDPFDPAYEPILTKIVQQKVDSYGVSFYLEKSLMLTDLFPEYDMTDLWVYLVYKKPAVLQAYLDLKAEERALKDSGTYDTAMDQRMSIAIRFGRLLGYTDTYLLNKLDLTALPPDLSPQVDDRSYYLGNFAGIIGTEAEFAMNESKDFSLSDPFDPADEPILTRIVQEKCDSYGVKFYLEKSLMLTDLFPEYDMTDLWVYIIYKKPEVLQAYLDLKAEEAALKASGRYDTAIEERKDIAFRFGKILGYTDSYLKAKLDMD